MMRETISEGTGTRADGKCVCFADEAIAVKGTDIEGDLSGEGMDQRTYLRAERCPDTTRTKSVEAAEQAGIRQADDKSEKEA